MTPRPDQIPPASVEALRGYVHGRTGTWLTEHEAAAAMAAALAVWPGIESHWYYSTINRYVIVLPLERDK